MPTYSQGEAAVWVDTYFSRRHGRLSRISPHGRSLTRPKFWRGGHPDQYLLPFKFQKPRSRRRN